MTACVFDSSALLAITFDEAGADIAAESLADGIVSALNAAEVVTRYIDQGASPDQARRWLQDLGLAIRPFDEGLALEAGLLREQTRDKGLSLGDRACLALGMRENVPVLTADRAWAELGLEVTLRLIR
ncbi:MAG: type II toxin-antitoxin system VapC family toxin [Gammaproteobacteria bacterium]|nr:type II toxin-antitoxin system VapC family toxin [Gammaproteobacteria bacterium]